MTAAIDAKGLIKDFGAARAVDGVTFTVAPGELFALLGPNGAGKTTTVRMLAGLIAPSGGRARVAGHDIAVRPDRVRASVGVLTEAPGLYDRLTAWENLLLFADVHEVPDPGARVERYLRLFDLWDERDEPTAVFSKGMKQKVALARALLHEPPILFLDEPTSGLDPAAAKTLRDFLLRLKADGRTIFLTTHNLDEADRLADRIGVLARRMIGLGTPEELRRSLFGRRTRIALAAPDERFLSAARAASGVAAADWEGEALVVTLADPERDTPDLVKALVLAGARIQSVTEERASLERIYLELVEEVRA